MLPTATRTTTGSLSTYLKEIGRIPLLTANQEITLARQVRELLKIEQIEEQLRDRLGRNPTELELAAEIGIDRLELRQIIARGRNAKNKMVSANLRLVVSIAKKYIDRGMHLQDLISEGTLGLIRATERFDPELGYKFSTYASWWVRQACSRAITDRSRTIRLPVHIVDKLNKIKKTIKHLSQSLGRQPSEKEIAKALDLPPKQLRFLLKSSQSLTSLDKVVGKEKDSCIGDLIADNNISLEKNFLFYDLNSVLDTLSEIEAEIIRLRYGLIDGQERTLIEIGKKLNLSRERIRQLEARALKKLRQHENSEVLRDYLSA